MTARLPIPDEETRRLHALHELLVLDSEPEPLFDSIVRTASDVCGTPLALITLVDADRQWFKAIRGIEHISQTSRDISFCTHTIATDDFMEVPDTLLDQRFVDNPFVVSGPSIRFYAGAPLVLTNGERVGTLCVLDQKTRTLDPAQLKMLLSLARMATQALELRRDLITRTLSARSQYEQALARSESVHRAMVQHQSELVSLSNREGELIYVNQSYARHFGRTPDELVGSDLFVGVERAHLDEARRQMDEVFETGIAQRRDFETLASDGQSCWVSWVHSLQRDIDGTTMLHSVGRDVSTRKKLEQVLAEKERFIRQITDHLPLQVAYVDTERKYRFANQPHIRRLGMGRDELIGRTRSEVTGGVDDADVEPRLAAALRGTEQRFVYEVDNRGTRGLMETRITPDFDDDGVVRGAFISAMDITARAASERSVRELVAIFDNTPDFVIQTDKDGLLTYLNPAARRVAGLRPREPIDGLPYSRFNATRNREQFLASMVDTVEKTGVWLGESTVASVDGTVIPVSHMVIGHRNAHGVVDRYSTMMRDISDEVEAKQLQLRQSATLRSVAEAIPASVAVVGPDRRYRFCNGEFAKWSHTHRTNIEGCTMLEVLGEELYELSLPFVTRAMAGERVTFEKEPGERDPDKHLSISYIPLLVGETEVDGFVVVVQDVTRQKREESRLKHLSQRDALTGLLNRAGLQMYVDQALLDPERDAAQLGLLYIDLDKFKPVNDTFGHAAGDELLKLFGRRLAKLVRPTDAVVRLGGDEFAVVLPGVRDIAGMAIVADKVVAMAQTPFDIGHVRVSIGASVGIALGVDREKGWPGLLERADAMLYKAKAAGRGQRCGAD